MITKAVIVQITTVSIKVPSMAIVPCFTGSLVFADACAIGALPKPASFENMPLLKPISITCVNVPLAAAFPVKAFENIAAKADGISEKLLRIIIKQANTYKSAIEGTIAEAAFAIRLTPPTMTEKTRIPNMIPVKSFGTPAKARALETSKHCTPFPMPKPASIPKRANNPPNQAHLLPRPFFM